jgi:hypothetical protein
MRVRTTSGTNNGSKIKLTTHRISAHNRNVLCQIYIKRQQYFCISGISNSSLSFDIIKPFAYGRCDILHCTTNARFWNPMKVSALREKISFPFVLMCFLSRSRLPCKHKLFINVGYPESNFSKRTTSSTNNGSKIKLTTHRISAHNRNVLCPIYIKRQQYFCISITYSSS